MPQDGFENSVKRFLSSRASLPFGLLLTVLVCTLLLYVETTGTLCFGTLLIAVSAYVIPRVFGMRDLKRVLIWGLLMVFLISGIAMVFTSSFYSSEEMLTVSSSDGILLNATVSPHLPNESGIYRFTVIVTETGFDGIVLELGDVDSVYLNFIMGGGVTEYNMTIDGNYSGVGNLYYVDIALTNDTNHFFVVKAIIADEVASFTALSPYPTLRGDDPVFYFAGNLYYLALNVGLPFFVLAFFSWWIRRNMDMAIERMREEGRLPPLETVCPRCGHKNPSALRHCAQCGEELPVFQPPILRQPEKKKETFMCSECGADVDEDATECPNCGEPFED
ncbi:MAG: zinc ribbon domain-containing protein [Candidatus Methanomethylophilaceae archaeon]|nr:zinc ribbon domain-containing protein [Candidatus Methanomethylophilaceae archaeon]